MPTGRDGLCYRIDPSMCGILILVEKQVTFRKFWLWGFEVFWEDFPISLSSKVAIATGDFMPNTARSKAWVEKDFVGTF